MTPITAKTVLRARWLASQFFAAGMDRDDLAQEALIGAWQARQLFDGTQGGFGPFERLVMRRRILDAVNHARKEKRGGDQPAVQLTNWVPAPDATGFLDAREDLRAVVAALPGLTDLERAALRRQVLGMPLMGKSEDNARHRAMLKLRAAA